MPLICHSTVATSTKLELPPFRQQEVKGGERKHAHTLER